MKIAYFDNFSGASGDMILAALLDAGLPLDELRQALAPLNLPGYRLSADKVMRHGISATQFVVHLENQGHKHDHGHDDDDHDQHQPHDHGHSHDHAHNHEHSHDAHSHDHHHEHEHDHHDHTHAHQHHNHHDHGHQHGDDAAAGAGGGGGEHHHRSWATIRAMIDDAHLPERAARRAKAIFQRLAEAEATVHGTTPDNVHFHEVGAVDSIVDIVGAALALELLGIERIYSASIPPGSGSVRCAHGVMPVPAPATALLLRGVPTRQSPESGELTTPTGAAILTTLAEQFGPMPSMVPQAIGTGTGSRPGKQIPNILRVFIGQATTAESSEVGAQADDYDHDVVTVLETNLDDATPEIIADAATRLLAAGALDVYTTAVTMKKGRSGVMLSCLTHADRQAELVRLMLEHTTTFGVRHYEARRAMLRRRHETVTTPYGQVRMKIGLCGETVVRAVPEFEDCRRAAEDAGISVQQAMQAAVLAWNGNS